MKRFVCFAVALAVLSTCSVGFADGPHDRFARRLNRHPILHHAMFGRSGAEVVYRSSGVATQAAAMQWWMNSPPHKAQFDAGRIHSIVCHGRVCVGR
jgi:hypothetical protein